MDKGSISLPETPGFNLSMWLAAESTALAKLLSRAKKSSAAGPAMEDPDNCETLPYTWVEEDLDPDEDSCSVAGWVSVVCFNRNFHVQLLDQRMPKSC